MSVTLRTFGHGTASEDQLSALIRAHDLQQVIDVRTVPRSRLHPHVWREEMEQWVPRETAARYLWEPSLGGFRRVHRESTNTGLRNDSFRGYADYMQSAEFLQALDDLMHSSANQRSAVMCSESVWWRCHRRLIADAATLLYDANVLHIMPDGSQRSHRLTEGVAREGDVLRYRDLANT